MVAVGGEAGGGSFDAHSAAVCLLCIEGCVDDPLAEDDDELHCGVVLCSMNRFGAVTSGPLPRLTKSDVGVNYSFVGGTALEERTT